LFIAIQGRSGFIEVGAERSVVIFDLIVLLRTTNCRVSEPELSPFVPSTGVFKPIPKHGCQWAVLASGESWDGLDALWRRYDELVRSLANTEVGDHFFHARLARWEVGLQLLKKAPDGCMG
jgi:hypothetical protein